MWRVLVFLGLLCVAAYGAVWLADNPETVAVTWAGREYSVSLAIAVVGFVAAALLLSFALGAMRYLVTLPSTIGRAGQRRKAKRGQLALTRGIVAVGSGDVAAARRYAGEAQRLLGNEPLALLLTAQAAQASGNREAAEAAFRRMVEMPETRVLGLRGLYLEARRRGDAVEARSQAEAAARAAPAIAWANDAVLDGLSADGDWTGALRMVERRASLGLVDKTTSRRQRAVLLTADALSRQDTDPTGALASAEAAVKLAPGLVPAAALAGRMLSRQGEVKRAARIIEAGWSQNPHPELAGAYLNLRPGDSAIDRLRRAETLARLSSWSDEARFAIARAAIEARDFPRARDVLRPLLDEGARPTVRLCTAMAEIEGRSGDGGAARSWLARAARAPRDKAWIADGVVSDHWAPVGPTSGRLDAFVWETPPDLLGTAIEHDPARFEPEAGGDEDLPAFLGTRTPAAEPAPEPRPALPAPPPGPVRSRSHPLAELDPEPAPPPPAPKREHPLADLPQPPTTPDATPTEILDARTVTRPSAPTPASGPTRVASLAPAAIDTSEPASTPGPVSTPNPAPTAGPAPEAGPGSKPEPITKVEPSPRVSPSSGSGSTATTSASAPKPGGEASTTPKSASATSTAAKPGGPDPEPVIFPVRQNPDDPGSEADQDRRQRFRLRV